MAATPAAPPAADAVASRARALPAPGPAWFGAVMGTGILAVLLQSVGPGAAGVVSARVVLVLAWVLLVGLTGAFVARCVRRAGTLSATWVTAATAPQWGMVSMGVLAVGSATATVVPVWAPQVAGAVGQVDALLWVLGTALGLATALGLGTSLVGRDHGAPTTVWGLAVVPPMVSATTGAALAGTLPVGQTRVALLAASAVCFVLALSLAGVVFAAVGLHHGRGAPVPLAVATSTWIPLGVLGQSAAAAQGLAQQLGSMSDDVAAAALQRLADGYATVVLALALPVVLWAVRTTVRGFASRMPFSPGWWALTFPVGTVSLGASRLGESTGLGAWTAVAHGTAVVLLLAWTLCVVATVRAVVTRRAAAVSGSRPAPA